MLARLALVALIAVGLVMGGCGRTYSSNQNRTATLSRTLHYVGEGETISTIARMYGVDQRAIIEDNNLETSKLTLGQPLFIYGAKSLPTPAPKPVVEAPKPAPAPVPSADWFTPRSAWAQEPILTSRINPMGGTPNRITVHHSNMPGDTASNSEEVLRKIDREHHKAIGKNGEPGACIGYHFVIAPDGKVYEGRPLEYQGAHAGGDNNIRNIGVCLLGDYQDHQVPSRQRDVLVQVLDRLRLTYNIPRGQVFGHRDFNPPGNHHTDCPGTNLYQIVLGYRRGKLGAELPAASPTNLAITRPAP